MEKTIEKLMKPEMKDIMSIQTAVLRAISDFMWKEKMTQLMPVMLSTVTDPLNHSVYDASLHYGDQRLELMKSMILHKQLSMIRSDVKGIYIISPNIRLEKEERGKSGRHLLEFSQVDIELRGASSEEFRKFTERLYAYVFEFVKKKCAEELKRLGRIIPDLEKPFKVYDSVELKQKYGDDFESHVSKMEKEPFWITDHYREFYDREDPTTKKHINYDLVYPEGFGEAMSGAERETEYDVIVRKMKERKTSLDAYRPYLEIAKKGLLKKTAGGGFGVERLVRYLTGKAHIRDAVLFPKVPGEEIGI
ncbi:MAG: asparagine synthetase A [Candidatus Micrarchaeota archaeon]